MDALHYADGQWHERDDPTSAWVDCSDVDAELKKLGFSKWLKVGEYPYSAMVLTVYFRGTESPRFYISVEGNTDSDILHVYANELPDVMDLLSKWTPVAQNADVVQLLAELRHCDLDGVSDLGDLLRSIRNG